MIALNREGFSCRIRSDAQGIYDRFGVMGAHLAGEATAERELITRLWPLQVGKSAADAGVRDQDGTWDRIEFSVADYGLARVPAGMFWAFKLRKLHVRQGRSYMTTLWWSPSLKWVIRQWPEEADHVTVVGGFNWDLTKAQLPERVGQDDR